MRALLLIAVVALAACKPEPPRDVVVVCAEGGDAGAPEPFEEDRSAEALGLSTPCAKACKNLSVLKCPEAWKLPGGRTCVETCKAISAISPFDPECVQKATSVAAVRKCPSLKCSM